MKRSKAPQNLSREGTCYFLCHGLSCLHVGQETITGQRTPMTYNGRSFRQVVQPQTLKIAHAQMDPLPFQG